MSLDPKITSDLANDMCSRISPSFLLILWSELFKNCVNFSE